MANPLNRDIEPGEVVMIEPARMSAEHRHVWSRAFVAVDGFGMEQFTAGRAIAGWWLDGSTPEGQLERIDSFEIAARETSRLHAEHGGCPYCMAGWAKDEASGLHTAPGRVGLLAKCLRKGA